MPKAIDTLAVLLERRGQVVEKAELMKLVWPDCVVEPWHTRSTPDDR
jgi:DNA-binding winged helix-turn-helix (wHTH) protein